MNAQEAIEFIQNDLNNMMIQSTSRDMVGGENEFADEHIKALEIVLESAKFLHENLDLNERTIDIEDGTLKYNTPLYINPVAQEKIGIKGE